MAAKAAKAKKAAALPALARLPPDWYALAELRSVLAGHDIGALYRWLNSVGVSQYLIARLIGTSQSQVADIIVGRRGRVIAYDVLVRIVEGLQVPRERMGLSWWGPDGIWYGPEGTYPGGATAAHTLEGVSIAMLRRHLIALGGLIMAGVPIEKAVTLKVGELLDQLSEPDPVPLPSKLTTAHVAHVRELRQGLEDARRAVGGDPAISSAVVARAEQLLAVSGPESVKQALQAAVARLHIHAGITAFNGCLHARTLYHFAKALDLARKVQDFALQSEVLAWAGLATVENGHPDDGLKMLQAAQVAAGRLPRDDLRRASASACPLMDSATALAMLGERQEAYRCVGAARDLWTPTARDPYGDMDRVPALVEIERGRLDIAEQFAATSVRRWENLAPVGRTRSRMILATVYVKAGEHRGLQLAHDTITEVSLMTSVRMKRQLMPLVEALEARPGSDAQELARMARQVAA